jgi:hypothetical protein
LLGVGTITILTHDISRPKLILRGVADIDRIFTLLEQARREAALHPPIANPSYETAANQNRPGSVVTSDQHPATLER